MAFCENCGRQIPDRARFCPACGTEREPTLPQQIYTPPEKKSQRTNTQTVTRKERQTRSSGSGKKIGKVLLIVLVIAALLAGGIFIGTQLGGDREQTVSERPKFTLFGMDNRKDAVSVNTEEWVYFRNRVTEEPAAAIEEPAVEAPAIVEPPARPQGFETYVSGDTILYVPENMQNHPENAAEVNMDFLLSGNDLVITGGLRPFDELTGSYITTEECAKLYCGDNSLDSESVDIWDGGNYHYLYYTTGGYDYFCAFYQENDGIWFLQIMAPMLNLDLAYTIADSVTISN